MTKSKQKTELIQHTQKPFEDECLTVPDGGSPGLSGPYSTSKFGGEVRGCSGIALVALVRSATGAGASFGGGIEFSFAMGSTSSSLRRCSG